MPDTHPPTFDERLRARASEADTLLCVGLDPARGRMPAGIPDTAAGAAELCVRVVEATADLALAYKPNLAFFLAFGREGLDALYRVRARIPAGVPVILDCKVGDVDSTTAAYATAWFDELGVDAITVHPYLGEDSLAPFLDRAGKGVIVLAKTSNPGSGDLQDRVLRDGDEPVYRYIAGRAAAWDASHPASVGLVVGATYPDQLRRVREVAPELLILLPGLGAQGGDLEASLDAALRSDGTGVLCSSSRGIMYAPPGDDVAEAARTAASRLRDQINAVRHARAQPRP
jgi:orotidine 5'-phosphate decarboxylase subfamily 2